MRVKIVTDGSIEFSTEVLKEFNIAIVPCRFQVGKWIYESSEQTPLQSLSQALAGAKKVNVIPPSHVHFLGGDGEGSCSSFGGVYRRSGANCTSPAG
jgi:fatty acid-binding protein DegV